MTRLRWFVLGLVIATALPAVGAFIIFPHTWVQNEVLTSSDLNAQFNAVSAQVNGNLDDSNISASAGIQGSKLATGPDGVGTAQLNDLSVTTAKLADGAVTNPKLANDSVTHQKILDGEVNNEELANLAVSTSKLNDGATVPGLHPTDGTAGSFNTSGTIWSSGSVTTIGRPVVIWANIPLTLTKGVSVTGDITLRLKRDGVTELAVWKVAVGSDRSGTDEYPFMASVSVIDTGLAPGSYTWTLTAETSDVNITVNVGLAGSGAGVGNVIEFG